MRWTPSDRQWKDEGLPDSLRLRVIAYQIKGFRPSAVVTSVLDPTVISRDEFVRLATVDQAGRTLDAGLYHRRWEIETTLSEIKVTQGMDGAFRSRTTEGIAFEVAGHLLLYFLVRRQIVEAALAAGVPPLRLSYKGALEDVKDMRESLLKAGERPAQRVLLPRLLDQIGSHVIPFRPGRHYPRPNDTKVKNKGKGKKQFPANSGPGRTPVPRESRSGKTHCIIMLRIVNDEAYRHWAPPTIRMVGGAHPTRLSRMKLPRLQFSVRHLLALVAVVALLFFAFDMVVGEDWIGSFPLEVSLSCPTDRKIVRVEVMGADSLEDARILRPFGTTASGHGASGMVPGPVVPRVDPLLRLEFRAWAQSCFTLQHRLLFLRVHFEDGTVEWIHVQIPDGRFRRDVVVPIPERHRPA